MDRDPKNCDLGQFGKCFDFADYVTRYGRSAKAPFPHTDKLCVTLYIEVADAHVTEISSGKLVTRPDLRLLDMARGCFDYTVHTPTR